MQFEKLKALASALALCAGVSACTTTPGGEAGAGTAAIENHTVRTVPLPTGIVVDGATYTPSGHVLVNYIEPGGGNRDIRLATVSDDGTGFRQFFAQTIPERPKDNGLRYMVFPDNRRIFLGDFVIECATSLETCEAPALLPVDYPPEAAEGEHIGHRWSEIIVAPDNRHIAWTMLLADYSAAMVFTGELIKQGDRYQIVRPQIVSTLDPFAPDPDHADGVLPQPMRGGEVKQFVHGGTALSLVGAISRDLPNSVVQHLDTGQLEAITDTPGYTETTIFSPDERLGIVMTTRFSDSTDPAILGLVPRPYPAVLNMGLSMFAYTYAVTGVRRGRPGSIGPALIDISVSKSQEGYLGIDLHSDPDWTYYSPMSWHPAGKKAMWLEGRKEGGARRIQVVELPDYRPANPVAARGTPDAVPYGISDLSVVRNYAQSSRAIDVKVYGRSSGHIRYRRTPHGVIEKTYVEYSDDGASFYSGTERTVADPRGYSTYTAALRLTGPTPGEMDLKVTFGPLGGDRPARIVFDDDEAGRPLSRGYAQYGGRRIDISDLEP